MAVSLSLAFFFCPAKIQSRYVFLHKFKHFPDVRRLQNFLLFFEVAWLLSFVHLCRHCHLCSWEIRGTGQKCFSKGFSYCRATASWCQRHHLTQFPSCLFQHLSPWHHNPVCTSCKMNIKYPLLASSRAVSITTALKCKKLVFVSVFWHVWYRLMFCSSLPYSHFKLKAVLVVLMSEWLLKFVITSPVISHGEEFLLT